MKKGSIQAPENNRLSSADSLVGDIRALIEETRATVAVAVNTGLTLLYWRIGQRIQVDVLGWNGQIVCRTGNVCLAR